MLSLSDWEWPLGYIRHLWQGDVCQLLKLFFSLSMYANYVHTEKAIWHCCWVCTFSIADVFHQALIFEIRYFSAFVFIGPNFLTELWKLTLRVLFCCWTLVVSIVKQVQMHVKVSPSTLKEKRNWSSNCTLNSLG